MNEGDIASAMVIKDAAYDAAQRGPWTASIANRGVLLLMLPRHFSLGIRCI